mmetsp:Transcript_53270/g.127432  ORF Transcript_53270/g.127432 Transcript_53270/m.127432 type:complete len:165 (+) Transcript_53270:83-577(+)
MPEYRGAGSFLYSEGHRICVSASHGRGLTKRGLQEAFGDFGHIYQIETPKPNLAFLAFAEKADASDALNSMDGKNIEGQTVTVSWAGPKPVARPVQREAQVLTSTKFEREDMQYARANYRDDKKPGRSPSPTRGRSERRRSRSRRRDRSRSRSGRRRRRRDSRS